MRNGQGRGHGKDAKAEANLSLSPLSSQRGAEERRVARARGGSRQGRGGGGKWGALDAVNGIAEGGMTGAAVATIALYR